MGATAAPRAPFPGWQRAPAPVSASSSASISPRVSQGGKSRDGAPIAAISDTRSEHPRKLSGKTERVVPKVDRRTALILGASGIAAAGAFGTWRLLSSFGSADPNSIAVLPFENLSGDSAKGYLSDGLAAELRARLARNPLLSVVGQASSNFFRDRSDSSATIAGKLAVANLLDGNVRVDADQIRIAVELIDGSSGFSKWSNSFDRPMAKLLSLQGQIAETVSAALAAEWGGKDEHVQSGDTANISAFEAFLRGRTYSIPIVTRLPIAEHSRNSPRL